MIWLPSCKDNERHILLPVNKTTLAVSVLAKVSWLQLLGGSFTLKHSFWSRLRVYNSAFAKEFGCTSVLTGWPPKSDPVWTLSKRLHRATAHVGAELTSFLLLRFLRSSYFLPSHGWPGVSVLSKTNLHWMTVLLGQVAGIQECSLLFFPFCSHCANLQPFLLDKALFPVLVRVFWTISPTCFV